MVAFQAHRSPPSPAPTPSSFTPDAAQTFEPVFTEQNGTPIPTPISLSSRSDRAYLILYDTSWQGETGCPAGTRREPIGA